MNNTTNLHIAIIPDGNRRWAVSKRLRPWQGHEKAAQNFKNILEWCEKNGNIKILTLWCFSTENWKRDKKEITELFKILHNYLLDERTSFKERKIKLLHSGRQDRIPKNFKNLLNEICAETKDNKSFTLHLAIDYGGKDEIYRAMQKITNPSENIYIKNNHADNDDLIRKYLDQPDLPDIDLIIRTSGEMRTSNFFLWQSAYSEWIFTKTLFPEFTEENLKQCIENYINRNRRYGS